MGGRHGTYGDGESIDGHGTLTVVLDDLIINQKISISLCSIHNSTTGRDELLTLSSAC
jgi:hypothetical protein